MWTDALMVDGRGALLGAQPKSSSPVCVAVAAGALYSTAATCRLL